MLSVSQQCELLGLSRSSYYYEPATESAENLALMALIDREYTAHPFRGSRGMTAWLRREGHAVNRKRVQRLMRLMGLEAVYPKPRLSVGGAGHKVYPYLLRNVAIERVNQVWSTDITYIPMPNGFMYPSMLTLAARRLECRPHNYTGARAKSTSREFPSAALCPCSIAGNRHQTDADYHTAICGGEKGTAGDAAAGATQPE